LPGRVAGGGSLWFTSWTQVGEEGVRLVPLSEDEQRILREIEQQFYATDPAFAREVGTTSLYRHGVRRLKLAALLFVVGVALLVWMLYLGNYVLAFALGAGPMFAAALLFESNLRKMGRAGIQQVTASVKAAGIRDAFGSAGRRARERFRRDDDTDDE
jgi:hypothetical protein